ncbi:MAG: sulfurtransferase [Gammaproteobacteria bacterium]|nr:MAG: sulfurtransferase [Gammaproteobacteria bacterium]
MQTLLPLLVEPKDLETVIESDQLLIVDLTRPEHYRLHHIPNAVYLDYSNITRKQPPVMGLLPDPETLLGVLSDIGWSSDKHVVAYDEEGGAKACRLLWTLHAVGHAQTSLLNGGWTAWAEGEYPISQNPYLPIATQIPRPLEWDFSVIADRAYILDNLDDPDFRIIDTRTRAEYTGADQRARKAGHIPGAIHFEWTRAFNPDDANRLFPAARLQAELEDIGISRNHDIVVYCQTHHRSAHTWFLLKWLGYPRVRGYAGAWSDWGNAENTPIEI